MRSRVSSVLRISLLPFALLLGSSLDRVSLSGPLPHCRKGEFLTMRGGMARCTDLVGHAIDVPGSCSSQLLTARPPDEKTWTCTPRAHIDEDKVAALPELTARTSMLAAKAAAWRSQPKRKTGGFVGTTTLKTTGLISRVGTEPGLLSAHALCSDEFPGTHLCSGYELHASVVAKLITKDHGIVPAWAYHPSWKTPVGPAQNAEEGLADNCAGYTYGADDRGWSGSAAEFEVSNSMPIPAEKVLAFRGGTLARCSASFPLACCK